MASDMWRLAGKHRCADPPNTDQDVGGGGRGGGPLNSWCKTIRRICQAAHIQKLLENTRGWGMGVQDALHFNEQRRLPDISRGFSGASENSIQAQLWISIHLGHMSDSGGGLSIL